MSSEVSAIRQLIEDWRAAVRASDVPRIVSYYAEDIVAFDAILQLQFKGRDAYQKHWQACTEMCKGPMTFDIAELQIHADPQVAFAHYLCHCGGDRRAALSQGCRSNSALPSMSNGAEKCSWITFQPSPCLR